VPAEILIPWRTPNGHHRSVRHFRCPLLQARWHVQHVCSCGSLTSVLAADTITVATYLGYRVGDPVQFSVSQHSLPTARALARCPLVSVHCEPPTTSSAYAASDWSAMQVSATLGGAIRCGPHRRRDSNVPPISFPSCLRRFCCSGPSA
jgi:hypothetical protein